MHIQRELKYDHVFVLRYQRGVAYLLMRNAQTDRLLKKRATVFDLCCGFLPVTVTETWLCNISGERKLPGIKSWMLVVQSWKRAYGVRKIPAIKFFDTPTALELGKTFQKYISDFQQVPHPVGYHSKHIPQPTPFTSHHVGTFEVWPATFIFFLKKLNVTSRKIAWKCTILHSVKDASNSESLKKPKITTRHIQWI